MTVKERSRSALASAVCSCFSVRRLVLLRLQHVDIGLRRIDAGCRAAATEAAAWSRSACACSSAWLLA